AADVPDGQDEDGAALLRVRDGDRQLLAFQLDGGLELGDVGGDGRDRVGRLFLLLRRRERQHRQGGRHQQQQGDALHRERRTSHGGSCGRERRDRATTGYYAGGLWIFTQVPRLRNTVPRQVAAVFTPPTPPAPSCPRRRGRPTCRPG